VAVVVVLADFAHVDRRRNGARRLRRGSLLCRRHRRPRSLLRWRRLPGRRWRRLSPQSLAVVDHAAPVPPNLVHPDRLRDAAGGLCGRSLLGGHRPHETLSSTRGANKIGRGPPLFLLLAVFLAPRVAGLGTSVLFDPPGRLLPLGGADRRRRTPGRFRRRSFGGHQLQESLDSIRAQALQERTYGNGTCTCVDVEGVVVGIAVLIAPTGGATVAAGPVVGTRACG